MWIPLFAFLITQVQALRAFRSDGRDIYSAGIAERNVEGVIVDVGDLTSASSSIYAFTKRHMTLVTYGHGATWEPAAAELAEQARNLDIFADIKVFTQVPEEVIQTKRWDDHIKDSPNGWWFWKPVIIRQQLDSIPDGDVVFYVDAGCEMSNGSSWKEVFSLFLDPQPPDVVAFNMEFNKEAAWTKADIFNRFHTNPKSKYGTTGQIAATYIAVRKSPAAVRFIDKWIDLVADLQLVSDWESRLSESTVFKENRNDQSLLSMLTKVNDWNDSKEGRSEFLVDGLTVQKRPFYSMDLVLYGNKYEKAHAGRSASRAARPRPAWAQLLPT